MCEKVCDQAAKNGSGKQLSKLPNLFHGDAPVKPACDA